MDATDNARIMRGIGPFGSRILNLTQGYPMVSYERILPLLDYSKAKGTFAHPMNPELMSA